MPKGRDKNATCTWKWCLSEILQQDRFLLEIGIDRVWVRPASSEKLTTRDSLSNLEIKTIPKSISITNLNYISLQCFISSDVYSPDYLCQKVCWPLRRIGAASSSANIVLKLHLSVRESYYRLDCPNVHA